ncbi:sushi, von Willebrand factor type A, EGF and pentraxin domain-containing protein 1-like [Amblyomma americanum]
MAPALRALKASCLILCLLHCSPTWAQEHNPGNHYLSRFPWESLPSSSTDLVFLLDRSGSVGAAGFEMQLGFVDRFLKYFEVAPNATRVAVISFSDDAVVHADFLKEPGNKCQLVRRMQDAKYLNHYATNTGAGLREVREVFQNSRPQAHKVLVLVTDGIATTGPDPVEEANKLKKAGVEVFVFSIGRSMRKHLDSLASSTEHVFEFESFAEFETFDKDGPTDRWTLRDSPRDCDRLCRRSLDKAPDGSERGSCCDKNAVCGCSLKSGLSACLCGPGFHGNGFRGQCAPCKPDTYKDTYDSNSCLGCPAHSGTRHEGSRSVKECACHEGYAGDPGAGVPCTVVMCPPLQPPEHGRIVECDNRYEGECLFQCDDQYEMEVGEGEEQSESRFCQADGTWSGKTTVCKAKSCDKPQDLENGYVTGCDSPWKVNATCTFHCNRGYELRGGSATRTCDEWKAWSGEDVFCEPVQCPPPPVVPNAIVGEVLKSKVYRFGEYFNPKCPQGFTLKGPPILYCNAQGQWESSEDDHSVMACVDQSKPTISCPEDIVVSTENQSASALVQWDQPRYRDNAGGSKLWLQQMPPGVVSPHRFEIGSRSIRFRVVDAAGLDATCSLTITVRDVEKPQVLSCPQDIITETAEDDVTVTWAEPNFADNSGDVSVAASHASGSKFGHGTHKVTYNARDASGNYATCMFRVTVSKSECPFYPAPLNGALSCDHWLHGQICHPMCNEKFDFLEEPAEMYVCAKDRRWYTEPEGMPVPWPDCARSSLPAQAKKKYHAFYYTGDCRDPEVQNSIKRAFQVNFDYVRSRLTVCANGNGCQLNGVTVRCGDMSEFAGTRRQRRSVGLGATSTVGVDAEVVLEFAANGTAALVNDTEDLAAAIDEIVGSIGKIAPSVLEQVSGEEKVTVQMHLINSSAEDVVIVCAEGETLSGQGCAKCPMGTFHDRSQGVCSPCPTGSYQDEEGTVSCKLCPEGAATAAPKSTSVDDCQVVCSPGTYSRDGLETCLACPQGTYQDERQQTRCKRCPAGSTTEAFGSTQQTDCKKYCAPGSYSDSGLQPCTPCKRGTYQNLRGQKSCSECPAPTTSLHEGSKSIIDCVDFDYCASNPCLNSTCVAHQHGFSCEDR